MGEYFCPAQIRHYSTTIMRLGHENVAHMVVRVRLEGKSPIASSSPIFQHMWHTILTRTTMRLKNKKRIKFRADLDRQVSIAEATLNFPEIMQAFEARICSMNSQAGGSLSK